MIQMKIAGNPGTNLERAKEQVREAADRGARVICLPELFRMPYFPREQNRSVAHLAEAIPGPSTEVFSSLARELETVIIVPLFEKDGGRYYNAACVLDADGSLLPTYRKVHLPQDPCFYEQDYFTAGNAGFPLYRTRYADFSVLICYDQWFPEAARICTLKGADILFYPTAIGRIRGETPPEGDWHDAWETVQRGHAIANGIHVAAVNRVGTEGELDFRGGSFACDAFGKVLDRAPEQEEAVLVSHLNLSLNETVREGWGFLRNRRPALYGELTHEDD
ncbi:MAG: carbon-nitrogen hydrolase [Deltaproteobacteria bacterium]|nr:carbon-nitrogen hydrolase [Deltaproteobacteria bacterium]